MGRLKELFFTLFFFNNSVDTLPLAYFCCSLFFVYRYTAVDRANPRNTNTTTRTVDVVDTLPPVISLVSNATYALDPGPLAGPRWTASRIDAITRSVANDILEGMWQPPPSAPPPHHHHHHHLIHVTRPFLMCVPRVD